MQRGDDDVWIGVGGDQRPSKGSVAVANPNGYRRRNVPLADVGCEPGSLSARAASRHPPGPANRARRPPSAPVLIALTGSELALAPLRFVLTNPKTTTDSSFGRKRSPKCSAWTLRSSHAAISYSFEWGGFDKLTEGKATRIEAIFAY
jgi:hypothetical protein